MRIAIKTILFVILIIALFVLAFFTSSRPTKGEEEDIDEPPKSFVFTDRFNYKKLIELYPDKFYFRRIHRISAVQLLSPSPNIKTFLKVPYILAVADPVENMIGFNYGDGVIICYGKLEREIKFNTPKGIDCSREGFIFVADTGNNRVFAFEYNGAYFSYTDLMIKNLNSPESIYVDNRKDRIYVCDTGNNRILKYRLILKPDNVFNGTNILEVNSPWDVTTDSRENIFVLDNSGKRIVKYDSVGNYLKEFRFANLNLSNVSELLSIDADKFDNLYIVDNSNEKIYKFDNELNYILSFNGATEEIERMSKPLDIFIYKKSGLFFITGERDMRMYKQAPGLKVVWSTNTVFSPFNIRKQKTEFKYILTTESLVQIFIKDGQNNLIRQIAKNEWKDINIKGYKISWDGKNDMGEYVEEGEYILQIIANVVVDIPTPDDFNSETFSKEIYDVYFKDRFGQEVQVNVRVQHPVIVMIENVYPKVITDSVDKVTVQYSVPKGCEVKSKVESLRFKVVV